MAKAVKSEFEKLPPCHSGAVPVFEIGNSTIWGARVIDIDSLNDWHLLVPLMHGYEQRLPHANVSTNQRARELLSAETTTPYMPGILALDWEDMGTPFVELEWWQSLSDDLEKQDFDVLFFCQGGHGRTGTALSILAYVSGTVPDDMSPVDWVRKNYCHSAVESYAQLNYIQRITGYPIVEEPSFEWSYSMSELSGGGNAKL